MEALGGVCGKSEGEFVSGDIEFCLGDLALDEVFVAEIQGIDFAPQEVSDLSL